MTSISSLGSGSLLPQEEKLEVKKQSKRLFIGVPKEIAFQEVELLLCQMLFNYWLVMVMMF